MAWILVVVVASQILTVGTADQAICEAAVAILADKAVAAVCVAAPVLGTLPQATPAVWML